MKSVTLKGLTDHMRILNIGYLLDVFALDVRFCFSIFAQKRPAPARPSPPDEKMNKKKPNPTCGLVEKNDFENVAQKSHDYSRKSIDKAGQFYVTLICSYN